MVKRKKYSADSFQIPLSLSTILKQKDTIFNTTDAEVTEIRTDQVSFQNNVCTLGLIKLGSKIFQSVVC